MDSESLGLLCGLIAVSALALAMIVSSIRQIIWPRVEAEVIRHEVHFKSEGILIVAFHDTAGTYTEARLPTADDGSLTLSTHPVRSSLEICYNPTNPKEASVPSSWRAAIAPSLICIVIVGCFAYVFLRELAK